MPSSKNSRENPSRKDLMYCQTVGNLKRYPGLEKLTDEEAKRAIESIKELSIVLFHIAKSYEIIDDEVK